MTISGPARKRQVLEAIGIESWPSRRAYASVEPTVCASPAATAVSAADVREPTSPAQPAPAPISLPAPVPLEMAKGKPPAAADVVREVSKVRDVPADWAGLQVAVSGCTQCKLCRTRTNTVFGVGLELAPLMVIGEGPGADEDAQGQPFVGRAGKLLDEMLKAIGRSRHEAAPGKSVYIANVVKCRPPANRDPEAEEVEACRPYLDQQIRLIQPKLILALGRVAAQRLLSTDQPLSKLRGSMHSYGPEQTPVLITYHPAYLLRSPGEKAKSWADLKRVHQFLRG